MSVPFYSLATRDIIETAKFFLEKIKETTSNTNLYSINNLNYYLYGFVISTFSIPNYMLYQKFIDFFRPDKRIKAMVDMLSTSEYVNEIKFYKKSCQEKNNKAINFIQFWICEKEYLMSDKRIKFLKLLRDHVVHRNLAIKPTYIVERVSKDVINFCLKGKKGYHEEDGLEFCQYSFDTLCEFYNKINQFYEKNCI